MSINIDTYSDEQLRDIARQYSREVRNKAFYSCPDVPRGPFPTDGNELIQLFRPCITEVYEYWKAKGMDPPCITLTCFYPPRWSINDCEEVLSKMLPDYIAFHDTFLPNTYHLREKSWLRNILKEILAEQTVK